MYGIAEPPFRAGALLPLKIDPDNHRSVVIDDSAQLNPMLAQKASGSRQGFITHNLSQQQAISMVNDLFGQLNRELRGASAQTSGGSSDDESLSERLRELKEAYDSGLITSQEYEAQRKRLLDEI